MVEIPIFAIAFTPLYDWIVTEIIKAPADIIEPGRLGLQIMTPWTWAIAHRRFHQGVLIRFGHAGSVGWGTGGRVVADRTRPNMFGTRRRPFF